MRAWLFLIWAIGLVESYAGNPAPLARAIFCASFVVWGLKW